MVSLSLPYKAFLRPVLLLYLHGFYSSTLPSWNAFPSGQWRHYRLPFVLPNSCFFAEASLFLIRVTLTRFALSSYEQAFRHPTSFPISEKSCCPLTCSCFLLPHQGGFTSLPSHSSLEPVFLIVKLNFLLHALAPTFFFSKIRDWPTLTLSSNDLVIWTNESAFFVLAKEALTSLETDHSVTLRPSFFIRWAQFIQVFCWGLRHSASSSLVSATPIKLYLLLLSGFCIVCPTFSEPPSFLLCRTPWHVSQESFYPFSIFIWLHASPAAYFFRMMTQPMSWSGGVRCSPLPHSASLRLLLGFTQLFSRVIKIFWYTGPLCIHRETHHVCCFLFYIYCNGYSLLLNSHQGRIGKIKIPQCCHCGPGFLEFLVSRAAWFPAVLSFR